jgi:hypothetical protein
VGSVYNVDMLEKGVIHALRRTERRMKSRFHHNTHNGMKFKTYELLIFGIFHLIPQLSTGN